MALSRAKFTSRYGDFRDMMEGVEEHGGFGNVTWNVGPHAGHEPYGKDHHVAFVPRHKILSGAHHPHTPEEMKRHAGEVGQQMDRGNVIQVPHIKFSGGRPVIDAKHHAALHAAGERGAERVPVVVNNKHKGSLMFHVGEVEFPGAPKADQEKGSDIKYRWNGKGWYTKPSFNEGRCPADANADVSNDKCIGGGPRPASAKPQQKGPGSDRDPAPGPGSVSAGGDPPAPIADRKKKKKVGPITAARAKAEIDKLIKAKRTIRAVRHYQDVYGGNLQNAKRAIDKRREHLRRTGRLPASGGAGAPSVIPPFVARDPNKGLPSLISVDKSQVPGRPVHHPPGAGFGDYGKGILGNRMDDAIRAQFRKPDLNKREPGDSAEVWKQKQQLTAARDEMVRKDPKRYQIGDFLGAGAAGAVFKGPKDPDGLPTVYKFDNAVMAAGLTGRHGLSILPRYISTALTSQKMTKRNFPLFAIHREDLDDAEGGGAISGSELGRLSAIGSSFSGLQDKGNRRAALKEFDNRMSRLHSGIMSTGGKLAKQWPKMVTEFRTLLEHGIVPCDLHTGNWGIRKHTGEISMRDVGCSHIIKD